MLNQSEWPSIVAGGGIINADASDLMARMVGLQTSHRYGNATLLESDFVFGIGNRWASRHTGSIHVYTKGRTFVHVDIEPTPIGRVLGPDFGIVSDARAALKLFIDVAREMKPAGITPDTLARAATLGINARARLTDNDGHSFFAARDDQVITGPTLTNVNDFRTILIAAA